MHCILKHLILCCPISIKEILYNILFEFTCQIFITSLDPVPKAQVCVLDSTYYKITITNCISKPLYI